MNKFTDLLTELDVDDPDQKARPSMFASRAHKQLSSTKLHGTQQKVNHQALADRIENAERPVMIYGIPGIGKTVGSITQAKRKAAQVKRLFVQLDIGSMAETQERVHERSIAAVKIDNNGETIDRLVSIVEILENVDQYYILLQGRPPEMHPLLFAGIPTEEEKWTRLSGNAKGTAEGIANSVNDVKNALGGSESRKATKLKNEENSISSLYMEHIRPVNEDVTTAISQPSPFLSLILSKPGSQFEDAMGTIFLDELTRVEDPLFFNLIMARLEPGAGYNSDKWKFVSAGNYGDEYTAQIISDPAIKNRLIVVELEHDPKAWLSWATDQASPPLHPHIRDFINNDKYKPFDKDYRLSRGEETPPNWFCCYDTSHDNIYHGKTYAQPKSENQLNTEAEEAEAADPVDINRVECIEACRENAHLINLLTPRDIQTLNSGSAKGSSAKDDYETAVMKLQSAVRAYYDLRDDVGEEGKTLNKQADLVNKELQELGNWVKGKINNGPWASAFIAFVKNQVDIEQGSSGTEDLYRYKDAKTQGFDKELESSMKTLFATDDKVTSTPAVKFYNLTSPDKPGSVRINPGACNLKTAICKFMGFEASSADDLSKEDHSIIAGKIYKVLKDATGNLDSDQTMERIYISQTDPVENYWTLHGVTDSALTTLFKWVYVIDKFNLHFNKYAASKKETPEGEDDTDDFLAGDLSLPGALPGVSTSGGGIEPNYVQGICTHMIDEFLQKLSKFNATSLRLSESSIRKPGSDYKVSDYGSKNSAEFYLAPDSGFTIYLDSGGKEYNSDVFKQTPTLENHPFIIGARALVACLTDIAQVVCPDRGAKLEKLDQLLRMLLTTEPSTDNLGPDLPEPPPAPDLPDLPEPPEF
jgi:hypothetical protein